MYQIYGMLGLMVLFWGVAIWASITVWGRWSR